MAIKESALAAITSITQSDFVRAVTAAGASRRITVANLAKAIIENYTGSSLAGSSQSVKAALDSLNSKTEATIASGLSGWCEYVQTGKVVTVQFVLTASSAIAVNSAIVSGLPKPSHSYTIGSFPTLTTPSGGAYTRVTDTGTLVVTAPLAADDNIRGVATYIRQ